MSAHHLHKSWRKVLYKHRPRIMSTLPAPCIECGRPVLASQSWHVAHRISVAIATRMGWTREQINAPSNLGPAHSRCNLVAGGQLGAAISNQKRQAERRLLPW